jgi:hypothetical protein
MVIFAGTMLLVTGAINFIEGLVALFQDERIVVLPNRLVLLDLTAWGWTLLLFGLAMFAVGAGLLATQTWARIAAIIVVAIHAIFQIFTLGAYPVWSLLMIALDTFVIFALTARWSTVRPDQPMLADETQPSASQPHPTYQ